MKTLQESINESLNSKLQKQIDELSSFISDTSSLGLEAWLKSHNNKKLKALNYQKLNINNRIDDFAFMVSTLDGFISTESSSWNANNLSSLQKCLDERKDEIKDAFEEGAAFDISDEDINIAIACYCALFEEINNIY